MKTAPILVLFLCGLLLLAACKKAPPPAAPPGTPPTPPPTTPPVTPPTAPPNETPPTPPETLPTPSEPATPSKAIGEFSLRHCNSLLEDLKSKVDKVTANIEKHQKELDKLTAGSPKAAGKQALIDELIKLKAHDVEEYNTAVKNCDAAENKDAAACAALKTDAAALVDTLKTDFQPLEEDMTGLKKSLDEAQAANNQTLMTDLSRQIRFMQSSYDAGRKQLGDAEAGLEELEAHCG